jgi:transposase
MAKKRRTFNREFKREAVRLARESGQSIGEIAEGLGIWETVLRRWLKQADIDDGKGSEGALTTGEKEELRRLRRECKQLLMEREILKKATAFFAKQSQ